MERFDFESFLGAIQKYRITFAPLVPPIVIALGFVSVIRPNNKSYALFPIHTAKNPAVGKYDISSLRKIGCGAAGLVCHGILILCSNLRHRARASQRMFKTLWGLFSSKDSE